MLCDPGVGLERDFVKNLSETFGLLRQAKGRGRIGKAYRNISLAEIYFALWRWLSLLLVSQRQNFFGKLRGYCYYLSTQCGRICGAIGVTTASAPDKDF